MDVRYKKKSVWKKRHVIPFTNLQRYACESFTKKKCDVLYTLFLDNNCFGMSLTLVVFYFSKCKVFQNVSIYTRLQVLLTPFCSFVSRTVYSIRRKGNLLKCVSYNHPFSPTITTSLIRLFTNAFAKDSCLLTVLILPPYLPRDVLLSVIIIFIIFIVYWNQTVFFYVSLL